MKRTVVRKCFQAGYYTGNQTWF